ncbi:HEPN domain-containing protein [Methylocapsa sp. S129]|uniref:HEPN domain-containing protein n=1 Tax=Methylocapsa sp. S129 TaxID=1641869 RepID=UPI00131D0B26|nr:HEPN domain-containing protein [Methylocapsa sp. S129]
MGLGHTRDDLRANAQAKLDDAQILLGQKRYSNAYYLAGYAVELGLKACIAAQISAETIPDKAFLRGILNHQFGGLVGLAGLAGLLNDQKDADPVFAANWALVSEWEPDSRYEAKDPMSASLLVQAIADPKSGVLQWIKIHW